MKRQQGPITAQRAKAVYVGIAGPGPIDELNAQFEGALGAPNELVLIDPERLIELADLRNGSLTHANSTNFIRFDQTDGVVTNEDLGHGRRGHPASGAAADDDNELHRVWVHLGTHTKV